MEKNFATGVNDEKKKLVHFQSLDMENSINISSVTVREYSKQLVLIADQKITSICSYMVIPKTNEKISYVSELPKEQEIQISHFSLFIGMVSLKEKVFLVFAERVSVDIIEGFPYYEIRTVEVYSLSKFSKNKDLSNIFTEYFKNGFLFSFKFDLTFGENFLSVLNGKYIKNIAPNKNIFYFINQNLIKHLLQPNHTEWLIPVIHGLIYQEEIWDLRIKGKGKVWVVYKRSIFSLNTNFQLDINLFQTFSCGSEFDTLDIFIGTPGNIKQHRYIFTKIPSLRIPAKFEKIIYQENLNSSGKAKRFFDFMKNYLGATVFFIESHPYWKNYEQIIEEENRPEYFFIGKIEKFFQVVPKLIQRSFMKDDDNVFCIVSNQCFENLCNLMSEIWEPILETPQVVNFKRRRSSSFDMNYLKNVHLKNPQEIITKFLTNIQNFWKNQSILKERIKGLKKSLEIDLKIDLEQILYGDKKNISQDLYKLINGCNRAVELFDETEAKISFITHNCSGVPEGVLGDQLNHVKISEVRESDFIIIGLQEIMEMKKKNLTNIIINSNENVASIWENGLTKILEDFILIGQTSMLGLMTLIFQKRSSQIDYSLSVIKEKQIKQGFLSLANKGGICLGLKINWESVIVFTCHLASGTKSKDFKKRLENLQEIQNYLDKSSQNYTLKIIQGDFNWRNKTETQNMMKQIEQYQKSTNDTEKFQCLQEMLKLQEFANPTKEIENNTYSETPIEFLPSYKWIPKQQVYDLMEGKRIPSWTDRILYNCQQLGSFMTQKYSLDTSTIFSDHRQFKKACLFGSKNDCSKFKFEEILKRL